MCLQDGYKLIRANQLLAALAAWNTGQITFRAFRVYLASHEAVAIREAAERSTKKAIARRHRRFRREEISALVAPSEKGPITRELGLLNRAALLAFSESELAFPDISPHGLEQDALLGGRGRHRLIPVPRKMLTFLAACSKPALAKTIIAYLLRGLSLDRSGEIRGAGTVKISWICKLCDISERAARWARAELIRLGWITKDTGSVQRKLNRDGAYFQINKAWHRAVRESAPPRPKHCTENAPPLERQETPSDSKNQKLTGREASGFRGKERGGKPELRNIQPEDIRKPSRLHALFEQAIRAGWLARSEANWLNFAAAAVRANRAAGDPVRIFIGIVRQGLWHHITLQDEERGRAVLAGFVKKTLLAEAAVLRKPRTVPPWADAPRMTENATSRSQELPQSISTSVNAILSNCLAA